MQNRGLQLRRVITQVQQPTDQPIVVRQLPRREEPLRDLHKVRHQEVPIPGLLPLPVQEAAIIQHLLAQEAAVIPVLLLLLPAEVAILPLQGAVAAATVPLQEAVAAAVIVALPVQVHPGVPAHMVLQVDRDLPVLRVLPESQEAVAVVPVRLQVVEEDDKQNSKLSPSGAVFFNP